MKTKDLTIGLEEELFLVDASSGQLCRQWPQTLESICSKEYPEQIVREYISSQVELITKPHETISGLHKEAAELRQAFLAAGAPYSVALLGASTHPIADWREQKVNTAERYSRLKKELCITADRILVGGMHVHIGVKDTQMRMRVMNELVWYLPLILALSSSSAFWVGTDSGLMSYRLSVLKSLPRAGLPDYFDSYEDYTDYIAHLVKAGAIENAREIWWDIRLSSRYPTVEIRVADTCPMLIDAISIAALIQCLVHYFIHRSPTPSTILDKQRKITAENRWRAQRYSVLEGSLFAGDEMQLKDHKAIMETLVECLLPSSIELGSEEYLHHCTKIVSHGTSSDRQRKCYANALKRGLSEKEALLSVCKNLMMETGNISGVYGQASNKVERAFLT